MQKTSSEIINYQCFGCHLVMLYTEKKNENESINPFCKNKEFPVYHCDLLTGCQQKETIVYCLLTQVHVL